MSIGKKIKHLREALGLSQNRLAKLCGINQALISRLEAGDTSDLRASTLRKLTDHLETTADALLERRLVPTSPDFILRSRTRPDTAALRQQVQKEIEAHLRKSKSEGDVFVFFDTHEESGEFVTEVHISVKARPRRGRTRMTGQIIEAIVSAALTRPELGCDRIACDFRRQGSQVSSSTVHKILLERGLNTRRMRVQHLQREADRGGIELSDAQTAAIEKRRGRSDIGGGGERLRTWFGVRPKQQH